MRFKLFYESYQLTKRGLGWVKERIENIIDCTSGITEHSRIQVVSDTHDPMFISMDGIEDDPYRSRYVWFMFAINHDFRSFREVLRFLVRVNYVIAAGKIKGTDGAMMRPQCELRKSISSQWNGVWNYTDFDLVAARLRDKDGRFGTFSYQALERTEEFVSQFIDDRFEVYYRMPKYLMNEGLEEWVRYRIERIYNTHSSFGFISNKVADAIQNDTFYLYNKGNKWTDVYLCPDFLVLEQMNTKREETVVSARALTENLPLRNKLLMEIQDRELKVDQFVLRTFTDIPGCYLFLKMKDTGIVVVLVSHKNYQTNSAEELWNSYSFEAKDEGWEN